MKSKTLRAIIDNSNYYLIDVIVYQDGSIFCWELIHLESFKERLESGKILITLPNDAKLHLEGWGIIEVKEFNNFKTNSDFVKEIEDVICELNDRKTRAEICRETFKEYLLNPNSKNYLHLKIAYEDLPSHQKVIMDYVDYKDPIVGMFERNETFTEMQRKEMLDYYFN